MRRAQKEQSLAMAPFREEEGAGAFMKYLD